jgi:Asp-tRNA(Asn)/Glu-tRNA(Gln) amidotransferase A subunit family amidase
LPSGLSADGLPHALQLIGAPGREAALLDVAQWCEARLGFAVGPSL